MAEAFLNYAPKVRKLVALSQDRIIDLLGQRFGRLLVIGRHYSSTKKGVRWLCRCDCGEIKSVSVCHINKQQSCGCLAKDIIRNKFLVNLTGKTFGRLTVISAAASRNKKTCWNCICVCGNKKVVSGGSLKRGKTRSCGCLQREALKKNRTTHGKSKTLTYGVWGAMKRRCYDEKNKHYKDYGGRGITVCERWHKFEYFLEDMGEKPNGFSIERIDNNVGYFKENCFWASPLIQSRNTRRNVSITFRGETKTIAEWSDLLGLDRMKAYRFHRMGLPPEEVIVKSGPQ